MGPWKQDVHRIYGNTLSINVLLFLEKFGGKDRHFIESSVCFIFSDRILCFVCLSGFHRTQHSLRGQSEKHLREEQFNGAWILM